MVLGIAIGWAFPEAQRAQHGGWAATDLKILSTIFLRMIKSLIVPLIFSTLVVGIAGGPSLAGPGLPVRVYTDTSSFATVATERDPLRGVLDRCARRVEH